MIETIKPLKRLPSGIRPGGDYASTQYALFLGLVSKEEIRIRNYNSGKDTTETITLLNSLGCKVERSATDIRIISADETNLSECAELVYNGGVLPLTLLIGYLAGKRMSCSLAYSPEINPDSIDFLARYFNRHGVDIFHEADARLIVFRGGGDLPDENKSANALPYLKNCLLMYALTNGQSMNLEEIYSTDDSFENLIDSLGGSLRRIETKSEMIVDPNDPRKKIRQETDKYRGKVELSRGSGIKGGDVAMPSDVNLTAALLLLAILKKDSITLEEVKFTRVLQRFIKLLKSFAVEIEMTNKKLIDHTPAMDIVATGYEMKGRKISGRMSVNLLELLPYLAVAGGVGAGNTVIRDAAELNIWRHSPFNEISMALNDIGIKSGALEDGLIIEGKSDHGEEKYGPYHNRETALAFYMLALSETARTNFDGFELVRENYPELVENLKNAYDKQLLTKQI